MSDDLKIWRARKEIRGRAQQYAILKIALHPVDSLRKLQNLGSLCSMDQPPMILGITNIIHTVANKINYYRKLNK